MNTETEALAFRAIACPAWRWLPGMLYRQGAAENRPIIATAPIIRGGGLPDLSDPATLGALLALVREAFGDPTLFAECHPIGARWQTHSVDGGIFGEGNSEAAALVAALEAASPAP